LFVGAMDWEPNVDAVNYFCADIWPLVLAKVPEARFRVVGRNPDHRVKALESPFIKVTGRVPSVVEHLREGAVVVVPLRVGGGTRIKIYEAMATGKAVVSTSIGAEGLDVHHGSDIVLADDAAMFAESVIQLLQDADARGRLGKSARHLASKYGWPVIGAEFGQVLESVIRDSVQIVPDRQKTSETLKGRPQPS
jgi:polysaccharide biosynthesis protein PslH